MYLSILCLLTVLLHNYILCAENSGEESWSYEGDDGPDNWQENYPDCGGDSQSPIEITPNSTTRNKNLGRITFKNYYKKRSNMVIQNNGHTVQLSLDEDDKDVPYIEGGGLKGRYYFKQLHFHWGKFNNSGSEHILVQNYGRTLEMHLVHTNPNEIENGKTGIAVIGILFEPKIYNNAALDPIINALPAIMYKGTNTNLETELNLFALVRDVGKFYRYIGSLTTPPCTEGVIWTLSRRFSLIGYQQMKAFRSLKGASNSKSMAPNFRPTQDINDRPIFLN